MRGRELHWNVSGHRIERPYSATLVDRSRVSAANIHWTHTRCRCMCLLPLILMFSFICINICMLVFSIVHRFSSKRQLHRNGLNRPHRSPVVRHVGQTVPCVHRQPSAGAVRLVQSGRPAAGFGRWRNEDPYIRPGRRLAVGRAQGSLGAGDEYRVERRRCAFGFVLCRWIGARVQCSEAERQWVRVMEMWSI